LPDVSSGPETSTTSIEPEAPPLPALLAGAEGLAPPDPAVPAPLPEAPAAPADDSGGPESCESSEQEKSPATKKHESPMNHTRMRGSINRLAPNGETIPSSSVLLGARELAVVCLHVTADPSGSKIPRSGLAFLAPIANQPRTQRSATMSRLEVSSLTLGMTWHE
jgi:hypothetical protein